MNIKNCIEVFDEYSDEIEKLEQLIRVSYNGLTESYTLIRNSDSGDVEEIIPNFEEDKNDKDNMVLFQAFNNFDPEFDQMLFDTDLNESVFNIILYDDGYSQEEIEIEYEISDIEYSLH